MKLFRKKNKTEDKLPLNVIKQLIENAAESKLKSYYEALERYNELELAYSVDLANLNDFKKYGLTATPNYIKSKNLVELKLDVLNKIEGINYFMMNYPYKIIDDSSFLDLLKSLKSEIEIKNVQDYNNPIDASVLELIKSSIIEPKDECFYYISYYSNNGLYYSHADCSYTNIDYSYYISEYNNQQKELKNDNLNMYGNEFDNFMFEVRHGSYTKQEFNKSPLEVLSIIGENYNLLLKPVFRNGAKHYLILGEI